MENNIKELQYFSKESTRYGFDLLSEKFESELFLSEIFSKCVEENSYEIVDLIVEAYLSFIKRIIDRVDYFLIDGPDSKLYSSIKHMDYDKLSIDGEEASFKTIYDITTKDNKDLLKKNIRFCLTYNHREPLFLDNYISNNIISKEPDERSIYYFIKDNKIIYIFDSYNSLIEDFRNCLYIDADFLKYRGLIDSYFED